MQYDLSKIENEEIRASLEAKLEGAKPGGVVEVTQEERDALASIMDIQPVEEIEYDYVEEDVSEGPMDTDLHVPGAKDDSGKTRLGLVLGGFNRALTAVGEVGTFGANKYSDNGWKSVPMAVERYRDAMYRHLLASDSVDPESGLPHMAHAAWNALAILQFMMEDQDGNTET